jgi:hypothetical protein
MTQATRPKKQPKLTAIELYQMRKWNPDKAEAVNGSR